MTWKRPAGRRGSVLFFAVWLAACGSADGQNGTPVPEQEQEQEQEQGDGEVEAVPAQGDRFPIRVGGIEIQVEIADDESERSQGLMFRESIPENEGMLFVYESERALGFWMRNTLIPLDIAYIDQQGRIVDIQSMEPGDQTTHWSESDAMYALEMNVGWFERNGIAVGALVEF